MSNLHRPKKPHAVPVRPADAPQLAAFATKPVHLMAPIPRCPRCGKPVATKAQGTRHDREYVAMPRGMCPVQEGGTGCWCVDVCWEPEMCDVDPANVVTLSPAEAAALARLVDQAQCLRGGLSPSEWEQVAIIGDHYFFTIQAFDEALAALSPATRARLAGGGA